MACGMIAVNWAAGKSDHIITMEEIQQAIDEGMTGDLSLRKTVLRRQQDTSLRVPAIYLKARNDYQQQPKYLTLSSNLLDLELFGDFTFQKVGGSIERLIYEGKLHFSNNDSLVQAYYAEKQLDTTDLNFTLGFAPREDLNPLLDFSISPSFVIATNLC